MVLRLLPPRPSFPRAFLRRIIIAAFQPCLNVPYGRVPQHAIGRGAETHTHKVGLGRPGVEPVHVERGRACEYLTLAVVFNTSVFPVRNTAAFTRQSAS